jgi:hypothetical protein
VAAYAKAGRLQRIVTPNGENPDVFSADTAMVALCNHDVAT